MTETILGRARNEGYREGVGQAGMVNYDHAYVEGAVDAERRIGGQWKKWWAFGVVCGAGLTAIIGVIL